MLRTLRQSVFLNALAGQILFCGCKTEQIPYYPSQMHYGLITVSAIQNRADATQVASTFKSVRRDEMLLAKIFFSFQDMIIHHVLVFLIKQMTAQQTCTVTVYECLMDLPFLFLSFDRQMVKVLQRTKPGFYTLVIGCELIFT